MSRPTVDILADLETALEWVMRPDHEVTLLRDATDRLAELDAKCDALSDEVFNLRMILVAEGITP